MRRSGRVPGTGKHICQKFALGAANSTPTKVLPSRALRIVVTLDSIDFPLFSLAIYSVCPTATGSSMGKSPPSRLTECERVLTENFSPASVCQRTVNPTVSVTRTVRRRSLNRKCRSDIDCALYTRDCSSSDRASAATPSGEVLTLPAFFGGDNRQTVPQKWRICSTDVRDLFIPRRVNSKLSLQSTWPARNAANNLFRQSSNPSPTC